jgi:acetamidase/formamidase
MGFSKDLKEATEHAVREMIAFLMEAALSSKLRLVAPYALVESYRAVQ